MLCFIGKRVWGPELTLEKPSQKFHKGLFLEKLVPTSRTCVPSLSSCRISVIVWVTYVVYLWKSSLKTIKKIARKWSLDFCWKNLYNHLCDFDMSSSSKFGKLFWQKSEITNFSAVCVIIQRDIFFRLFECIHTREKIDEIFLLLTMLSLFVSMIS